MKILEIFTGSTETSFINRIEEMEELLSGSKDMMEEMNKLMKEHVKSKNIWFKNTQEIWDSIKRPKLRITKIEKWEELHLKGLRIFNKIIVENFPNLNKKMPIKVREAVRTPKRSD